MAVREETVPELKEFQIPRSWVPITPAKANPSQTTEQPMCSNWEESQSVEASYLESSRKIAQENLCGSIGLPENFLRETQCQTERACCDSPNLANVYADWVASQVNNSHFGGSDVPMYFSSLLACAQAGGKNVAGENAVTNAELVGTSSSDSTQHFYNQIDSRQFMWNFGHSTLQMQENEGLVRGNFEAGLKIPNVSTDGSSTSFRTFFSPNSPSRSIKDAGSSNSFLSQIQPMTPDLNNKAALWEYMSMNAVGMGIVSAGNDAQGNIFMGGAMELHGNKEKSQLILDQSHTAASRELQENHKPDKGDMVEAELLKTPQQKLRRKKHRPKVIIEGQSKSTPKSSGEKTPAPQETPRARKKYVRRKGVNNPVEGSTGGTDLNVNTPETGKSVGKRKCVRRKVTNKPEANFDNGTTEKADAEPTLHAKTSCRRSLNFDPDCHVIDGNSLDRQSPYCGGVVAGENLTAKDQSRNEQYQRGIAVTEKSGIGNSHDCARSPNQVCQRGKCQIIFSGTTHDKETNIGQMRMNPIDQSIPKSMTDSISSSSMYSSTERQVRGLKRHEMATTVVNENSNRNETGAFYNSLQKYHSRFSQNVVDSDGSLRCQPKYKKKRIEMGQNSVTSSLQHAASTSENHMKFGRRTTRDSCTNVSTSTSATQNGRQVYETLLALGPRGRAKKSRKAPTRVRKLNSLMEIHKEFPASQGKATTSRTKQGIEILHEPNARFEHHITDTSTLTTEKGANLRMLANLTPQYSYQKSTVSIGAPLALTWNYKEPTIDSITEQLNQLDLNANSHGLVAYHTNYQEQQALVPFQGVGAVVPFDSSFDQVRRRRPRPKVDLDDETTRVWRLLLENINNEGINGTDEEKARWWEEERRVFRGRADSFIARMHLVQGDRRFSPWKGSVVDSAVGVFLTQNVSDHLSSSAFMALAARFPIQEKTHPGELHEETLEPDVTEAEVCKTSSVEALGLNKQISDVLAYGNDTKSLQDFEGESVRDVNRVETSGKNFGGLTSEDNLGDQLADASKNSPAVSRETVTNKSGSSIEEDGRDTEDSLSSQNSTSSPIAQTTERSNSCFYSTSEQLVAGDKPDRLASPTPFLKLMQMADNVLHEGYVQENKENASDQNLQGRSRSLAINLENEGYLDNATAAAKAAASSNTYNGSQVRNTGGLATHGDLSQKASVTSNSVSKKELCAVETSGVTSESASQTTFQKPATASFLERSKLCNNDQSEVNQISEVPAGSSSQERIFKVQVNPVCPEHMVDVTGSSSNIDSSNVEHKEVNSNKYNTIHGTGKPIDEPKGKGVRTRKEKEKEKVDWDCLRKEAQYSGRENVRIGNRDSVDWDAVRCADVSVIADTIKERGMNNMLAERIKDFLNRIVRDHGSIDLEWLRGVPPDKAKEYLLSFRGLGLKSVECVRLLTLHHLAFPVDTNVGRIAVRLGWVPLRPLPESLQLHLLELYPVLESIQKYLWPRLCKLDQRTLYELHYQMITFGKVFCTKSKPNCNACPMRGECRHFASAFASARLALPAPGETSIVSVQENKGADQTPMTSMNHLQLPSPHMNQINSMPGIRNTQPIIEEPASPEPIIEVPASPEPTIAQASVCDIESAFEEDPDEIPTIQLNMEEFAHNLQKIIQQNNELQEGDMSKALVALTAEAASIPVPKLKNVSRLRTEHQVYELPDSHPLLKGMDKREPDDPSPYLLAIWTPGETVDSIEPPERRCNSQGLETLCTDESCVSCNSIREANSQTVRGTLLIPCRTAMRGSFPLNGTYFQVNEVFSDHESSMLPMAVPRQWLWNLPRRTVYFGTSIPTIFKGLSTEGIQYCFWRGFVCVRGFDRKTRAPRPLIARLHFPASRLAKGKGKTDESNQ